MVEIGNGDQRAEDHFVGSDQMIEIGKGGRRLADHFVEVTDMVEVGNSGQRVELFEVQVPGKAARAQEAQEAFLTSVVKMDTF
jgi:hypothetical protein